MVKVGDRVRVVGYKGLYKSYDSYGTTGIVTRIHDNGNLDMKTDKGFIRCGHPEDFAVISTEPPRKITKNGYEYSLVGPVKPEWLVDGAWVVRKDNGCKHQVVLNKNGLLVLTMPGTDYTILPNRHIYGQYRPHTASDYKWGDWAMYDGKRVFVIGGVDNAGRVFVSYPDIYPLGRNDADRNFLFVPSSKLTPTF